MRRFPRLAVTLAILAASALASCGGGSSGSIEHPGGDALVFRIEMSGGLMGVDSVFTGIPSLTLLGDGRLIEPGAVEAIYPGPALVPLTERTLSKSGLQAVLREIAATGLFTGNREFNGAQASVMDASTTIFTLHADGRDARIAVYALGAFDPSAAPNGVSADEIAAHGALAALSARLTTLDSWLGAAAWSHRQSEPYRASALRLLVRNADADAPDASGIANQLLAWPVGSDPTAFGAPARAPQGARCGVVTGPDAAAWLAALEHANSLTRFVAAGHRYAVTPRPLLPDEPTTCPA